MRALTVLLLLAPIACAQHLGFGIRAGVPLTDALSSGGLNETDRFEIGPMIEFRLPLVSVEADALYNSDSYLPQTTSTSRASASSWEFPIMGKVRLPLAPIVKPYGEAGVSFRAFTGGSSELSGASKKGFLLGLGIDIHAIILHITPELRYTRWGSGSAAAANPLTLLQANQNQFEFLVGISR